MDCGADFRESALLGGRIATIPNSNTGTLLTPRSLPLITISIVRTISFTIYSSTKRIINSTPGTPLEPGEKAPWINLHLGILNRDTASNVAMTSLLAGAASGAVVCIGSAPFELVKVSLE